MANEGSQEVQEDSPVVCVIHYFSESIATVLQILYITGSQPAMYSNGDIVL